MMKTAKKLVCLTLALGILGAAFTGCGGVSSGTDITIDENGNISAEAKASVEALLHRSFKPEFLNRLDEIIMYRPLTKDNMKKIVTLQLAGLAKRLEDRQLHLKVNEDAKEVIIEQGYDPAMGARPLKRYIQGTLETEVAAYILREDPSPDTTIEVYAKDGALAIRATAKKA